jgi:hypothetical protein
MTARPPRRRRNGSRRLPSNIVYRSIQAGGGPTAVQAALDISERTLWRWRRDGIVTDARSVLEWARLIHPQMEGEQLRLARLLSGLDRGRRQQVQGAVK